MVVVEVIGGFVLLVGALLAVDWFTAGRAKGRILGRAKDAPDENSNVGYAVMERDLKAMDRKGHQYP